MHYLNLEVFVTTWFICEFFQVVTNSKTFSNIYWKNSMYKGTQAVQTWAAPKSEYFQINADFNDMD